MKIKMDATDVSKCCRCGSKLNQNEFCADETCPFSDHKQYCKRGFYGMGMLVDIPDSCSCSEKKKIEILQSKIDSVTEEVKYAFTCGKIEEDAYNEILYTLEEKI